MARDKAEEDDEVAFLPDNFCSKFIKYANKS